MIQCKRILHHPWHPTIVYQATVSAAGIATGGVQGMMARRIAMSGGFMMPAVA